MYVIYTPSGDIWWEGDTKQECFTQFDNAPDGCYWTTRTDNG